MKIHLAAGAATLALGLVLSCSASAATLTETVSFTATDFFGSSAPIDPVTGSFTVTFDPSVADTAFQTATLNSLNIPGIESAGPVVSLYEGGGDIKIMAGDFTDGPDFTLELTSSAAVLSGHGSGSFSDELGFDIVDYNLNPATDPVQLTDTGTFTVTSGAVPEPATWAMMLVGFGGLGAMLRRAPRRRLASL